MAKKKIISNPPRVKKGDDKYMATAIVSGIAGIAAAILISKQYFSSDAENNSEEQASSTSHYLSVGALCALVGAGAALLLAPKAGKALRRDICNTCEDVQEYTNDLKENFSDQANRWTSKARKVVNKIYDDAEELEEEYADSLKDKVMKFIDLAEVGLKIFNSLSRGK